MDLLKEIQHKRASRRNFITGAVAASAATALVGCSDNTPASTTTITSTTYVDADYLNFALNLEYLEASYYLYAATGSGLSSANLGSGAGTVTGGVSLASSGVSLTSAQQNILNEIAFDEQAHVAFLRSALSSSAVACPNINISATTFTTLANAASITGTFSPYTSFTNFLLGAFIFEDVGVTAYSGAAVALTSAANLNYAAGIQAVEAYHAAYVRTALTALDQATPSAGIVATANKISALRGSLGGGMETQLTSVGATVGTTPSSIVAATSANAIAYARGTDQVLHIVYGTGGAAGVSSGLFFPNGLNGNIKTTAS